MVWIKVPWFLREERPDCALIIKKASGASSSFYLRIQGHIGVVFCPVNLILKGQIRPFSSKKKEPADGEEETYRSELPFHGHTASNTSYC